MENSQQKIRHIPIFVEGREEPVINRRSDEQDGCRGNPYSSDHSNTSNTTAFGSAESSNAPFQQSHHSFTRPSMNFGSEPLQTGSIFERAKDFPVRDFFNEMRSSPRRSESPINVHQQQVRNPSECRQNRSQERSVPVQHDVERPVTPQRSTNLTSENQQNSFSQSPQKIGDQNSVPAKQKAIEDSIAKIQKIQQSVMDLMARVELFDGSNNKEYLYLDEMLTQNLLKLDNIDAEGKENIKNARREAIKCINHLISLLEVKKEGSTQKNNSDSVDQSQVASQTMEPQSAEESLEAKINAMTKSETK